DSFLDGFDEIVANVENRTELFHGYRSLAQAYTASKMQEIGKNRNLVMRKALEYTVKHKSTTICEFQSVYEADDPFHAQNLKSSRFNIRQDRLLIREMERHMRSVCGISVHADCLALVTGKLIYSVHGVCGLLIALSDFGCKMWDCDLLRVSSALSLFSSRRDRQPRE
ncbi:unnamed protein product, partial [Heterotrigona itama]